MEHIRLEDAETIEELNLLQQELLDADPDDPRFLDIPKEEPASRSLHTTDDVRAEMKRRFGGTLPPNLLIIGVTSFADFTQQFAKIVMERQRREEANQ